MRILLPCRPARRRHPQRGLLYAPVRLLGWRGDDLSLVSAGNKALTSQTTQIAACPSIPPASAIAPPPGPIQRLAGRVARATAIQPSRSWPALSGAAVLG